MNQAWNTTSQYNTLKLGGETSLVAKAVNSSFASCIVIFMRHSNQIWELQSIHSRIFGHDKFSLMSSFCFHSRPGPQFFQMIQLLPAHRHRRSPLSQNFCRCRAVSCEGKSDSCFQLHQPANGKTADASSEELGNCLQQSHIHKNRDKNTWLWHITRS